MDIDIDKLQRITDRIFDHIRQDLEIDKISMDQDYYWNIPSAALYDMDNDPKDIDVGQLSDDLDFLLKLPPDKDQAISLMFIHLAPLLRYIGEKVGQ